jgi:hypothetical protein
MAPIIETGKNTPPSMVVLGWEERRKKKGV